VLQRLVETEILDTRSESDRTSAADAARLTERARSRVCFGSWTWTCLREYRRDPGGPGRGRQKQPPTIARIVLPHAKPRMVKRYTSGSSGPVTMR
jgi:hypothetical protein